MLEIVLFPALRSSGAHGTVSPVPHLSGLVTGPGGRCIYGIGSTASSELVVGRVLNGDLESASPRTIEGLPLIEYKSRGFRHMHMYLGTFEIVDVLHDI